MMQALRHFTNIMVGRFSKQLRADKLLEEEKEALSARREQQARSRGLRVQIDLLVDQINRSHDGEYRHEAEQR